MGRKRRKERLHGVGVWELREAPRWETPITQSTERKKTICSERKKRTKHDKKVLSDVPVTCDELRRPQSSVAKTSTRSLSGRLAGRDRKGGRKGGGSKYRL